MFADFPQMLAYARSPPNFGGLTADEKKTDFSVGVYDHKAAQLVWVFFVVVVTYVRLFDAHSRVKHGYPRM